MHDGIEAHTDAVSFKKINQSFVDSKGFPIEGNYFLDEDITLTERVTVSDTLNLCLNGHIISGLAFTASARKEVSITNCQDKVATINGLRTQKLQVPMKLIHYSIW